MTDPTLHPLYPQCHLELRVDTEPDGSLHQVVVIVDNVEIDITQAAMDLPCVTGKIDA